MSDYLNDIEEIHKQSKECRTRYEQIKRDWNDRLFKIMYVKYADDDDGRSSTEDEITLRLRCNDFNARWSE